MPRTHLPVVTPPPTDTGVRDTTLQASQTRASPLACHGDVLVQSVGDELRAWNVMTMQRAETWTLPHRHMCFVQDGTLIAFGFTPKALSCAIHRIANGKVTTLPGPILPQGGTNVVLPARAPDQVYVTVRESIYLLDAAGSRFEQALVLDHPDPHGANRDQLIARGDGRLVALDSDGGFRELAPGKHAAYALPGRRVMHLAAATRDRVWYSFATISEDWNAHTLVLAHLEQPIVEDQTLDFAPARIVHVASHAEGLAVLLFTLRAIDDMRWSVAVFDERGRERWRADVPETFGSPGALNQAFVAIGEHRVVLAAHDGALLAWDASSGQPVRDGGG